MNPHLAALLAQDPHIFEPLPVTLEYGHMLFHGPRGPALDVRTEVTLTNETTGNSVSVIISTEELQALHDAITTHLKEITQ